MTKMRHGMSYKAGDIVLIRFPLTNLQQTKKRPVLLVKDENELGDFVCFQITSKEAQTDLLPIQDTDIATGELTLISFVKYDKCFTLSSELVDKKLASINDSYSRTLKNLFCSGLF